MSTYDAGAIEASARLGKDPFLEGLKQLQRAGDDFAARTFTATADVDQRPASRALDDVRRKGDEFAKRRYTAKLDLNIGGHVGFDALVRKAEAFGKRTFAAKVDLDIRPALVKLAEVEARLEAFSLRSTVHTVGIRYVEGRRPDLPPDVPRPGGGGGGGGSDRYDSGNFSVLGTAIVSLAPALIPIAALAVGAAGALAMMGVSGVLAFKGIQAEEAKGSRLGQQFSTGLAKLKRDLSGLEATAARGVIAPFSQIVGRVRGDMPFLNAEVSKFSIITGKTGGALFQGVINSLHVLDPLFTRASVWILHIAQGFEQWTGNGGLQKFETYAEKVLPQAQATLEALLSAVVRVTTAAGPFGMVSARALELVSDGINMIPLPVLKVLVTTAAAGYLAFQAWAGLSPAIATVRRMTAALAAYEAVQLQQAGVTKAAALANSSALGGLKLLTAAYGPFLLAGLAAAGIVLINNKIADSFRAIPASASEAAKGLAELSRSGELTQDMVKSFGASTGKLNSVLENTFAESTLTKIKDFQFGMGGIVHLPFNTATNDAKNFWKSTDDGLSQLITLGDKVAADNAFKVLTDAAAKQGVTVDQLLGKLPQYKTALDNLAAVKLGPIRGLNGELMATSSSLDAVAGRYRITSATAQGYAATLGITSDMVKNSTVGQRALEQAVAAVSSAENVGTAATTAYIAAVDTFSKSAGTAADRGALIGATLRAANGDALGYAGSMVAAAVANQSLVSGFDKQQRAAINLKTGVIDFKNAAAGPLIQGLQAMQDASEKAASATFQHERQIRGAKQAAADAADQYYAQTHGALIAEASQLGLTKDQAKRLADQYFALPKDIKTRIEAIGTDPVVKVLDMIGKQLSYLTHVPWISQVGANTTPAQAKLASLNAQLNAIEHPRGGPVVGANTDAGRLRVAQLQAQIDNLQGKTVPIVIQTLINQANQAAHVDGATTPGHRSAFGNIYKAYAYGGFSDDRPNAHQPAIYPVRTDGRPRVFAEKETGGEVYAPLANDHRRPRAKSILAQAVGMMGGAAYFADGGFGFTNVLAPTVKPPKGIAKAKKGTDPGYIFNNHLYATLTAAETAKGAAGDSLVASLGAELSTLGKLASATASVVSTAMAKIAQTIQRAQATGFGQSRLAASLRAESALLLAEVGKRTKIAAALAAAQKAVATTRGLMVDKQAEVARGVMGGFDIATSGNGYASGISSSLDQQVADAQKFAALLDKARALGLNSTYVDELAVKGPQAAGANLEAIVNAGTQNKGYITHVNDQYAALNSAAQAAGKSDAQSLYGAQLAAEQRAVAKDAHDQLAEQRAINKTLADIRAHLVELDRTIAAQAAEAHRLALARARSGGARNV